MEAGPLAPGRCFRYRPAHQAGEDGRHRRRRTFPSPPKNPEVQRWFDQGNDAAPLLLGLRGGARLPLVPEAGARQRHGVLGTGPRSGGGRPSARASSSREAVEAQETRSPSGSGCTSRRSKPLDPDPTRCATADATYRQRNDDYRQILETHLRQVPRRHGGAGAARAGHHGRIRYGTEQMIREILAKQPDHPGAHHYRIHNWN